MIAHASGGYETFFADQGLMTKENKKTWKGKVAKQWKRMQGSGSGTPMQNSSYPEGGSIGKKFLERENYFFLLMKVYYKL